MQFGSHDRRCSSRFVIASGERAINPSITRYLGQVVILINGVEMYPSYEGYSIVNSTVSSLPSLVFIERL